MEGHKDNLHYIKMCYNYIPRPESTRKILSKLVLEFGVELETSSYAHVVNRRATEVVKLKSLK